MERTSRGDLILRVDGSGQFVRLIYDPFDFGFDAPPAEESQLMPKQMTSDGKAAWMFKVHPAWNDEERGPCTPLPKEVKGRDGKPLPIDRKVYFSIPGGQAVKPPPIDTLQCLVVLSWSKIEKDIP
jgi:hypothetical protein